MKNKRRRVIGDLVTFCMIVIAFCNVFIHQTLADLTLAIGVIFMGKECFINLLKENK